ncbi:hypothetical protein [Aliiroseovarius sp. F20344]|uniref:hypothetical protein n=1 Tax=Aliiroseovarius sp. F20344 TaxID=2926414 RepID=UPI001FF3834A|nr:hypothetical protein [Aliiroseovarius sp. F20344]MCK0142993.1 hypothetical protein [Aliiroseovarius sp. F20344]
MGINELLKSANYYLANVDELNIEQDLWASKIDAPSLPRCDPEHAAAMRAALVEIDRLKVSGDYEAVRARLFEELGLEKYKFEGFEIPPKFREFLGNWHNLRDGMESPDEVQRERFQKFFETAQIQTRELSETHDLIRALEPAKKQKGRPPGPRPPWRKYATALDEMRILCAEGVSILEAARQVAKKQGLAQEESRAKYLERHYRNRKELREIK